MDPSTNKSADEAEGTERRFPTWARVLFALVLGNGLGYAAYVRLKSDPPNGVQKSELPAIPETRVQFDSDPPGARVTADGLALGVTPFARSFPRLAPDKRREFVFELEGYQSSVVRSALDQDRIQLQAALNRVPEQPAAPAQVTAPEEKVEPAPVVARPAPQRSGNGNHRIARRRVESQPPARARQETSVPKLREDARPVPKVDEERASAVPKVDEERAARGVPKVDEERSNRGVPRVDDGAAVPKLGDDRSAVPKIRDESPRNPKKAVPKLDE